MEDKRTRKERNMRSRSVFCTVFTSLLLVLLVQMGVLIGLAWAGGGMAQHGRNPWGACLAVLLLGLVTAGAGSLLISRRVSRPVRQLFREVEESRQKNAGIPDLSRTGLEEIDRFSDAVTRLSREIIDASTHFSRILGLSNVDIGVCEFSTDEREDEARIFVTDNFFPLLGMGEISGRDLTAGALRATLGEMKKRLHVLEKTDTAMLIRVKDPGGAIRYVRLHEMRHEGMGVLLAENVTEATMERLRIEHERDYDLLTGLYNRRAFYRIAGELFACPQKLGHAVLLMMDLDDLKKINDAYGHEWGDRYIRAAGKCFKKHLPANALCARVSGDEFNILLYGYAGREAAQQDLDRLAVGIQASTFERPDGLITPILVSGGAAWYPDDSTELQKLIEFSDFAMYRVKHGTKGMFMTFDPAAYDREQAALHMQSERRRQTEREEHPPEQENAG